MINITTDQKVNLTVSALSALGRVVPVSTLTGVILWNSSDVNVVTLVVAADGLSASAIGVGAGIASVNVIGNAGTEAVPVQITGSIELTVIQAPAASLSIVASTPVNQ